MSTNKTPVSVMGDHKSEKTDNLWESMRGLFFSCVFNDHWSQCLRCTICFCTLKDPHTLDCGHTFCKRCLKRLADIERADNPDIRRRILILVCPTCRHPFPAKPTLRGKTATNIAMKHVVEIWERECKMLLSSAIVSLRSLPTQTSPTPLTEGGHEETLQDKNQAETILVSRSKQFDQPAVINSINMIKQAKVKESGEGLEADKTLKNTKNATSKSLISKSKSKDIVIKPDNKRHKNDSKDIKATKEETSAKNNNISSIIGNEKSIKDDKRNNKEETSKSFEEGEDISSIVIEERMRPGNKYLELLMKRVIDFYNEDDDEDEPSQKAKVLAVPANPASPGGGGGPGHESDTDASRSSSSNSNTEFTVNTHSDASLSDIFGRIAIPRISLTLRRDYSFGRLLLIGFWFLYTAVIVAIADSFMPYITIATFFTLLLFLG